MSYDSRLGAPPSPADPWEAQRWQFTALAERIMDGTWGEDLEEWLVAHYGTTRRDALGPRDLSSNVLRTIAIQLSALFDDDVEITHATGDYPELLAIGDDTTDPGLIAATGLWPLMQSVQPKVLALGEYVLNVSHTKDDGLLYRPVSPTCVLTEARPSAPEKPIVLRELRKRKHPTEADRSIWAWDVYDIENPDEPTFRILAASKGNGVKLGDDITSKYLKDQEPGYFWIGEDGKPRIPYVVIHRQRTGKAWAPYTSRELVDGTLTVAALWTDFVHAVRDASWLQRVIIGGELGGATPVGNKANASPWMSIPADRSSILNITSVQDGVQPQFGAFPAPSDPDVIGRAIMKFEERLAQYVGVNPSDLSRTSGDPRSGYALAVSEHGKESAQKRYLPTFRVAVAEIVALTAIILNRVTGSAYPESGYRVKFAAEKVEGVEPGQPVADASKPKEEPAALSKPAPVPDTATGAPAE